jgi:hypothetical protein
MEIHINWPRNIRKPWEKKEAHLLDNLGLKHRSKCSTMNPYSGGSKPNPNPSRAVGASPGKMDAQDASRLRFGPSTSRKDNKKIYKLTKYGAIWARFGCGRGLGLAAPLWIRFGLVFL